MTFCKADIVSGGGRNISLGDYTEEWKALRRLVHGALQRCCKHSLHNVIERQALQLRKVTGHEELPIMWSTAGNKIKYRNVTVYRCWSTIRAAPWICLRILLWPPVTSSLLWCLEKKWVFVVLVVFRVQESQLKHWSPCFTVRQKLLRAATAAPLSEWDCGSLGLCLDLCSWYIPSAQSQCCFLPLCSIRTGQHWLQHNGLCCGVCFPQEIPQSRVFSSPEGGEQERWNHQETSQPVQGEAQTHQRGCLDGSQEHEWKNKSDLNWGMFLLNHPVCFVVCAVRGAQKGRCDHRISPWRGWQASDRTWSGEITVLRCNVCSFVGVLKTWMPLLMSPGPDRHACPHGNCRSSHRGVRDHCSLAELDCGFPLAQTGGTTPYCTTTYIYAHPGLDLIISLVHL